MGEAMHIHQGVLAGSADVADPNADESVRNADHRLPRVAHLFQDLAAHGAIRARCPRRQRELVRFRVEHRLVESGSPQQESARKLGDTRPD